MNKKSPGKAADVRSAEAAALRRQKAVMLHDRFTHADAPSRLDRRAFMAELTRIAGGSAAAAALLGGIAASASAAPLVAADDRRLRGETIRWEPRPGRLYPVYHAAPARRGRGPGMAVIVIHENRGLNDHVRDVARRLAVAGFDAYAPDFLGPAGGTPSDEDEARRMIGALAIPETVADGAEMIARLGEGGRKVGIIGFCWGGAMVNRLAVAAGEALDAGIVFYGSAPPLADAVRVRAPLLIHLAERDERVNATALPWVAALRAAGRDVRAINHHGVDHAFHNDTSEARYDATAARRAWAESLAFLRRHARA
jgi:carboxymethylenebutenolidase